MLEIENDQGRNFIHVEDIAEFLSYCSKEIQQKVKLELLRLDHQYTSIYNFLKSIAKGIVNINQPSNLRETISPNSKSKPSKVFWFP